MPTSFELKQLKRKQAIDRKYIRLEDQKRRKLEELNEQTRLEIWENIILKKKNLKEEKLIIN